MFGIFSRLYDDCMLLCDASFEAFMTVVFQVEVFCVATLCSVVMRYYRFRGPWRACSFLHFMKQSVLPLPVSLMYHLFFDRPEFIRLLVLYFNALLRILMSPFSLPVPPVFVYKSVFFNCNSFRISLHYLAFFLPINLPQQSVTCLCRSLLEPVRV
jgi:hypothetical protein